MFKKSRKDQFVEQAQGMAHDLSDAIAPRITEAREALAPKVADARDAVAPKIHDARDAIAPRVAGARDTLSDHVADARDTYGAKVSQAVSEARSQAASVAAEAERRGTLASAALKGEEVERSRSKTKAVLLIAALAGVGALVARKLSGGNADNWQSSYTPAPTPAPAPPAGASPGETVADSVEQPHPVTTPDDPAEVVDLDETKKP